jgi:iron complex transport system permease protein
MRLSMPGLPMREHALLSGSCLPIALMAIVVGMALGLAGAEMQTILNNPLASPFTLGSPLPRHLVPRWLSFLVWVFRVFPISGLSRLTPLSLPCWPALFLMASAAGRVATSGVVLFGIALVFTFNALISILQFVASEDTLQGLVFWTMGSLARASWDKLILSLALLFIVPLSLKNAWKLTALRLGEDRAVSFGINVRQLRMATLLRISIISALTVAFVGPVGFIGLVAPHISRMLFGETHRFCPAAC